MITTENITNFKKNKSSSFSLLKSRGKKGDRLKHDDTVLPMVMILLRSTLEVRNLHHQDKSEICLGFLFVLLLLLFFHSILFLNQYIDQFLQAPHSRDNFLCQICLNINFILDHVLQSYLDQVLQKVPLAKAGMLLWRSK